MPIWELLCLVLEAYFCERDQSREHIQLNVLNADKSSSFDENLFSEAAKSFRAKFVEWIVWSSWLLAFGIINKDVTIKFSKR